MREDKVIQGLKTTDILENELLKKEDLCDIVQVHVTITEKCINNICYIIFFQYNMQQC